MLRWPKGLVQDPWSERRPHRATMLITLIPDELDRILSDTSFGELVGWEALASEVEELLDTGRS